MLLSPDRFRIRVLYCFECRPKVSFSVCLRACVRACVCVCVYMCVSRYSPDESAAFAKSVFTLSAGVVLEASELGDVLYAAGLPHTQVRYDRHCPLH